MLFSYSRTIRFADTDGAGVVYFAQIFSICHEAYEASLASQGIDLRQFFRDPAIAFPIVHAEANFRQPMFCGDDILVTLQPQQLSPDSYEIKYEIHTQSQLVAQAQTKHVCINSQLRTRQELPIYLYRWIQESTT